jgi:hypothetical protein
MSARPVGQVDVGRCKSLARLRWKGAENPGADRGPDGPRGLASRSGVAAVWLHAQGMPATLQEGKVRGRIVRAARPRERIAERTEAQKSNHRHPGSARLLRLIALASDHPTKINRAG